MAELKSLLRPGEPVALWAISVDTPEQSREFARAIGAAAGGRAMTFPLLSDRQHQVIAAYGLPDSRYLKQRLEGIPYPAVYVIDKSGKVAWARVERDYTQRPTNRDVRAALDAVK